MTCPRCFYNKLRFHISPPQIDPDSFALSNAIDKLRKEESDFCREFKTTLRIIQKNDIEAFPFEDEKKSVQEWRKPFFEGGGLKFYDKNTNLSFFGSVDDIFINPEGKLIVIEFKSTSTKSGKLIKEKMWHKYNMLQVSFFAWLLKKNNYNVAQTGYLIYSNAIDRALDFYPFNNRLYFKTSLIACNIDYNQVEEIIMNMYNCLGKVKAPEPERYSNKTIKCFSCRYYKALRDREVNEERIQNEQKQSFKIK